VTFAEVHFPNGENLYLPTGRQLDKLVRLLGRRARKKNQDRNEEFERRLLPDTPKLAMREGIRARANAQRGVRYSGNFDSLRITAPSN
jgi:hypothetical protein